MTQLPAVCLPRTLLALAACALPSGTVHAQQGIEFNDDFSSDSIAFIVDERPDDRQTRSYDVQPDRIEIRVSASESGQGDARVHISDRTDVVHALVRLSSETVLSAGRDADAKVRIEGDFYNEIQDGGLGDGDRTGDVFAQAGLRLRGDGGREFRLCLDRTLEDGSGEGVQIFSDSNCVAMPDFVPELDTVYEIRLGVDREAGTIAFAIDDRELVTPIGQPIYLPSHHNKRIAVQHQDMSGEVVASVLGIGTDGELIDFAETPLVSGPYRPLFDLEEGDRRMAVVEGRVRYEIGAPAEGDDRLSLPVFGISDRIEATLTLSSESTVATDTVNDDDSFVHMRVGGTLYNDTAAGGFNDNEGNVFAGVYLRSRAGGERVMEYCLYRSNTADFSDVTELVMGGGTECGDFGFAPALDTPYPVTIEVDRTAGEMRFTANGIERVHAITTAVLLPDPARVFISTQAAAGNGSRAIGYLDDFRTSADAPLVSGDGDEADGDGDGATPVSSGGSGGSGGCSIGGPRSGPDPLLALMCLAASAVFVRRRRIR